MEQGLETHAKKNKGEKWTYLQQFISFAKFQKRTDKKSFPPVLRGITGEYGKTLMVYKVFPFRWIWQKSTGWLAAFPTIIRMMINVF